MQNGRIAPSNEHWELLAVAWARAKETDQAVEAYGKVAQLSGSGEAHLRQAELYMQNDEWQKVINATDQALKLGKLKSPGRAHLLRGMAYTQMREYPQGLNAFGEARRYNDTASTATRWVQYIRQRQQVES
jgi:tetratricopeptide (TPR) repeat protein